MNAEKLLEKYYGQSENRNELVLLHSRVVAEKAVVVAENYSLTDEYINFIYEGALLHDIGVLKTYAPSIGCYGKEHYITHGITGRMILEEEGLGRYGMICERHIGTGLTAESIKRQNLPLPYRDMYPLTIAETIITYCDLFFSKSGSDIYREKSIEEIEGGLKKFGNSGIVQFRKWHEKFSAQNSSGIS